MIEESRLAGVAIVFLSFVVCIMLTTHLELWHLHAEDRTQVTSMAFTVFKSETRSVDL